MIKNVIYKIISTINGEIYVGSASFFASRKLTHLKQLKSGNHGNIKLQRHVNKYGIEDLYFEIIEDVSIRENLIPREQFYIDTLNPYFNICRVAGSSLGIKMRPEVVEKMRERMIKTPINYWLGKKRYPETVEKIISSKTGKKASDETRKKMSISQSGKKRNVFYSDERRKKMSEISRRNYKPHLFTMRGRKSSEDTKKKISEANKNRILLPLSEEQKQRLRIYNSGRRFSEETKQKISQFHKSRIRSVFSEDAKQRMRISHIGKSNGPCSEETKQKISKANKGKKRTDKSKMTNQFKKGLIPWNKGIPMTDETKTKLKQTLEKVRPKKLELPKKKKAAFFSPCYKMQDVSVKTLGRYPPDCNEKIINLRKSHLGHKDSEETKHKKSKMNLGVKRSKETKKKLSDNKKIFYSLKRRAA